jgi:hypothetical protein
MAINAVFTLINPNTLKFSTDSRTHSRPEVFRLFSGVPYCRILSYLLWIRTLSLTRTFRSSRSEISPVVCRKWSVACLVLGPLVIRFAGRLECSTAKRARYNIVLKQSSKQSRLRCRDRNGRDPGRRVWSNHGFK